MAWTCGSQRKSRRGTNGSKAWVAVMVLDSRSARKLTEGRATLQDMWQLERDREKYEKQAKDSAGKHAEAIEQVELRELAIADIQKKVGGSSVICFAKKKFACSCQEMKPLHHVSCPDDGCKGSGMAHELFTANAFLAIGGAVWP